METMKHGMQDHQTLTSLLVSSLPSFVVGPLLSLILTVKTGLHSLQPTSPKDVTAFFRSSKENQELGSRTRSDQHVPMKQDMQELHLCVYCRDVIS